MNLPSSTRPYGPGCARRAPVTPLERETDLLAWTHQLAEQAAARLEKASGRTSGP
ncbi:MAG: hypothetical protein K0R97_911 [Oerskovia sp.]|jgi:hypothetical protein|nr:hypothetical protein [Oerskovia sp.]